MEWEQTEFLLLIQVVSAWNNDRARHSFPGARSCKTQRHIQLQSAAAYVCPFQQLRWHCLNPCCSAVPMMDNKSVVNVLCQLC